MSIEEILGQARDLWDAMTQKRVDDYKGLVKAVHAGRKVKPEQIVEVLDAARKTLKDLESDVALVKQRDVWKKMEVDRPVLSARQSEINVLKESIDTDVKRRIREIEAEAKAKYDQFKAEEYDISLRLMKIIHENPHQKLIETSSLFDEVMAAHEPVPGAVPISGMHRHDNIHSFNRERDFCAAEVRKIKRQLDEAEKRRADSLAIFGVSAKIDGEIARHKRELAEANEKLREAEAVIENLNAAIASQKEKAAKVEALAIAE